MELLEWVLLGGFLFLLCTFLWVIAWSYKKIKPLLESFTNESGQFELPKMSIKNVIAYGIYKAVETIDFTKVLGGFGLGGTKK